MVTAIKKKLTLAEFLAISETQPAQEFINGEITYKPMPQGEHSRLQYIRPVGKQGKINELVKA